MSALLAVSVSGVWAQGPMMAPANNATPGKDSIADPVKPSIEPAHGLVVMAGGSAPTELVEIHMVCGGAPRLVAIADAKGHFDISLAQLKDVADPKACVLRAYLDGYSSATIPVARISLIAGARMGTLGMRPLSQDSAGLTGSTRAPAGGVGRKAFEKGLDDAARQDWKNALKSFQKAVTVDPEFSSAWLSLGILQQSSGDRDDARKSFVQSARMGGKFALPLIRMAVLDAAQADWQATVEHSQQAIDLNPTAFPHAYELNAIGNLYLLKTEAAEKSAIEGLKLDAERRYPELEYALGMVLKLKNDREGAMQHFQAYVDEAPNAPHIAPVKVELTRLRAAR